MGMKKRLSSFAPALSAVLVVACIGVSLAGYTPEVYAVQTPEISGIVEETSEEVETGEGQVFNLADGTYEGTGTGYAGKITVSVEIKDKKIVAIDVLYVEADDEAFFNRAKGVIDKIIAAQSLDVDVVSGATYSSNGIISAVRNALTGETDSGETAAAAASTGQGSTTVEQVTDAAAYKDGTYYGTGTGFAGPLTVKVVISGGKIASIEITETKDDASYLNKAKALISKIISGQSTNVDTVSGATYSSVGIINAVRNALAKAAVSGTADTAQISTVGSQSASQTVAQGESGKIPYVDGVYYGTGEGYGGDITVAVVIQNKTIKAVLITDAQYEDEEFFNRAKVVAENVVTAQSTKVDTVSGATYSSRGILEAIENALLEAKKATEGNTGSSNQNSGNGSQNSGNGTNNSSNGSQNDTDNSGNSSDENTETGEVYADGVYDIVVRCEPDENEEFEAYNLSMKITIKGDRIFAVSDVEGDGASDNNTYIRKAVNGTTKYPSIISQILNLTKEDMTDEKLDTLDVVSNATCTSESIREACKRALATAKEMLGQGETTEE